MITEAEILAQWPLVQQIARLVTRKIPPHDRWRHELDDLIGAGAIGLMRASRGYDPAKGASFRTYASHKIRSAMADRMRDNGDLSRWHFKRLQEGYGLPVIRVSLEAARCLESPAPSPEQVLMGAA